VKRLAPILLLVILLFLSSNELFGQRGQRGGQGGGPAKADPSAASIRDFKLALAVQADPDQTAQYQALAKTTEAARKRAQELQQLGANADIAKQANDFKAAVEQASSDDQDFMRTLSKAQRTLLKELVKKYEKADSELAKHAKEFSQQVDSGKIDAAQLTAAAQKLDKALGDVQAQQKSLADEMGIQNSAM
jgi:chromosome segregation ATPase